MEDSMGWQCPSDLVGHQQGADVFLFGRQPISVTEVWHCRRPKPITWLTLLSWKFYANFDPKPRVRNVFAGRATKE